MRIRGSVSVFRIRIKGLEFRLSIPGKALRPRPRLLADVVLHLQPNRRVETKRGRRLLKQGDKIDQGLKLENVAIFL